MYECANYINCFYDVISTVQTTSVNVLLFKNE